MPTATRGRCQAARDEYRCALRIYGRTDPNAQPFQVGATNPCWKEVVATRAPASLTLDVGHYNVVVEKFRDFNASEADMDVSLALKSRNFSTTKIGRAHV